MTELARQMLEVDVAAAALANMLGRTRRADEVRRHLSRLRRAVAQIRLYDMTMTPRDLHSADLLRQAIDLAIQAGLSWPEVAAIVNRASETRRG